MASWIDAQLGRRMKLRRQQLGLKQADVASALGVSFQQIQKYEAGKNRVAVETLLRLCETLHVPPAYFFDGLENPATH